MLHYSTVSPCQERENSETEAATSDAEVCEGSAPAAAAERSRSAAAKSLPPAVGERSRSAAAKSVPPAVGERSRSAALKEARADKLADSLRSRLLLSKPALHGSQKPAEPPGPPPRASAPRGAAAERGGSQLREPTAPEPSRGMEAPRARVRRSRSREAREASTGARDTASVAPERSKCDVCGRDVAQTEHALAQHRMGTHHIACELFQRKFGTWDACRNEANVRSGKLWRQWSEGGGASVGEERRKPTRRGTRKRGGRGSKASPSPLLERRGKAQSPRKKEKEAQSPRKKEKEERKKRKRSATPPVDRVPERKPRPPGPPPPPPGGGPDKAAALTALFEVAARALQSF